MKIRIEHQKESTRMSGLLSFCLCLKIMKMQGNLTVSFGETILTEFEYNNCIYR